MHILSAAGPADPLAPLGPALLLAVGAAAALGVFRRGSIVGPARLNVDEPLDRLGFIAMGGFAGWWFISIAAIHLAGPSLSLGAGAIMVNLLVPLLTMAVIFTLIELLYPRPGRLGIRPRQILPGLGRGIVAMIVVVPLLMLALVATDQLWRRVHLQGPYVHEALTLLDNTQSFKLRAALLLAVTVVSPISEELFFRGCVQTLICGWLAQREADRLAPSAVVGASPSARARWIAVIATSLFFASAHPWWSMPPIFVLALCLGYAYERTGNLWTAIFIHALFNAAEVTLFLQTFG